MKVVFFGTPFFSAQILKYLIQKKVEIIAVVTQPDKEQGRNLKLQEPAVKKIAKELIPAIPILQPHKISTPEFVDYLLSLEADIFVVVAFGQIFPEKLLKMPRLGCINVHTSLLPKYRGAAPIQRCLLAGEKETGVTIMYMVKELDAGDILAVEKITINPNMNVLELTVALCEISKKLLYDTMLKLNSHQIHPIEQDHSQATYAKKITPQDGHIRWENHTAGEIYQQYRGVTPTPGAWCFVKIRGKSLRLKINQMHMSQNSGEPGHILSYDSDGIVLACKQGAIQITQLQLEGKSVVAASEFVKGYNSKDLSFTEVL